MRAPLRAAGRLAARVVHGRQPFPKSWAPPVALMNRIPLLVVSLLLAWLASVSPALAAAPKSLSIKDLGLGRPKKPEAVFEPRWSIEAGVIAMSRTGSSSVVLAETSVPGQTLNATDPGFGLEWGPYVSLSTRVLNLVEAEIIYFGVYDWSAGAAMAETGGITTGVFDTGGTLFDRVDASYTSRFDSVEVNTRYPFLGKLHWLAGFRWVGLEERSTTMWDGRTSGTDFAFAAGRAKNQLYGAQMGIDGPLWQPSARLYLDGMVKACVFTNRMSAGRDVDGTMASLAPNGWSDTRAAFLGELGLTGRFALTQNFVLGLGYQLTWIDGVASGFSPLGGQRVSSVLFHGLKATVELRW
ncbi:MAG: hypothetical protein U1E05_18775 [Patescibacteria group bacterium]|nr:hypothetical protein [Patescibacteria group bacterium]